MKKRIAWLAVASLLVLSMIVVACSSPAAVTPSTPTGTATTAPNAPPQGVTPSTPTGTATTAPPAEGQPVGAAKPQYGGTISLILSSDPSAARQWDLLSLGKAAPQLLSHNYLWNGDWAKGPAGTNEVPWNESTNVPSLNVGELAESITWEVSTSNQTVTSTIEVRQGVHYALDPNSGASHFVNGREVTTDDVLYCLNAFTNDPASMDYQLFPQTRGIMAVKTGPWEIQVTYPFNQFLDATMRQFGLTVVFPPELRTKYGTHFNDWQNDVGTGPYMIEDYVPDSLVTMKRNDNYWVKDPVGSGIGNRLLCIQTLHYLIVPDTSTQQAALRTGKVDQLNGFNPDDADQMKKTAPDLLSAPAATWNQPPAYMRTDLKPFNDVRVRQALMMATDFEAINKALYQDKGQILSWPTWYEKAYAGLYLGLDDPEMPANVKELYTYHPNKAKQLLADAGYPNGLKTSIIVANAPSSEVDYYSIIKDQWAKVGIDLTLDIRDSSTIVPIAVNHTYQALFALFYAPDSTWPEQANYTNPSDWVDASLVDDPYVNEQADKARSEAVTDFQGAMAVTKNLMKYLLLQAYCIPTPRYPQEVMWWPWLKNYVGETTVGYFPGNNWVQWVWIDQALKKSMGH